MNEDIRKFGELVKKYEEEYAKVRDFKNPTLKSIKEEAEEIAKKYSKDFDFMVNVVYKNWEGLAVHADASLLSDPIFILNCMLISDRLNPLVERKVDKKVYEEALATYSLFKGNIDDDVKNNVTYETAERAISMLNSSDEESEYAIRAGLGIVTLFPSLFNKASSYLKKNPKFVACVLFTNPDVDLSQFDSDVVEEAKGISERLKVYELIDKYNDVSVDTLSQLELNKEINNYLEEHTENKESIRYILQEIPEKIRFVNKSLLSDYNFVSLLIEDTLRYNIISVDPKYMDKKLKVIKDCVSDEVYKEAEELAVVVLYKDWCKELKEDDTTFADIQIQNLSRYYADNEELLLLALKVGGTFALDYFDEELLNNPEFVKKLMTEFQGLDFKSKGVPQEVLDKIQDDKDSELIEQYNKLCCEMADILGVQPYSGIEFYKVDLIDDEENKKKFEELVNSVNELQIRNQSYIPRFVNEYNDRLANINICRNNIADIVGIPAYPGIELEEINTDDLSDEEKNILQKNIDQIKDLRDKYPYFFTNAFSRGRLKNKTIKSKTQGQTPPSGAGQQAGQNNGGKTPPAGKQAGQNNGGKTPPPADSDTRINKNGETEYRWVGASGEVYWLTEKEKEAFDNLKENKGLKGIFKKDNKDNKVNKVKKPKKPINKDLLKKAVVAGSGFAVGMGLSLLPGVKGIKMTLSVAKVAQSGTKFVLNAARKTKLNVATKKHPEGFIAAVSDRINEFGKNDPLKKLVNSRLDKHPKINAFVNNTKEKLKNIPIQVFINGVAVGYIVGHGIETLTHKTWLEHLTKGSTGGSSVVDAVQSTPSSPNVDPTDKVSQVTTGIDPDIDTDVVPNDMPDVDPNIDPDIVPNDIPDVDPNIDPDIVPNDIPDVDPNINPDIIPEDIPDVDPIVPTDINLPEGTSAEEIMDMIKSGESIDVSSIEYGYKTAYAGNDISNAVHLLTDRGKDVTFLSEFTLPDGTKMIALSQANGAGYAWLPENKVIELVANQMKNAADVSQGLIR